MAELWEILLLATVQGVAEFLPISSSGHLVVLGSLLGLEEIADLNIVLHVGTLLSILVFYWRHIQALLGKDRRIAWLLAAGSVPAIGIGLAIKKWGPAWLESPLLAGFMLIVTGVMLVVICRWRESNPGERGSETLSTREAMWIGLAQAAAILPGLSRSGSTIAAGMSRRLTAEEAASFSFLLAIPIIAGGGCYEALKQWQAGAEATTPVSYLLAGAAVAFVVGYVSLHWLSRLLSRGRLDRFAWWCIPLGVTVVVWQLLS